MTIGELIERLSSFDPDSVVSFIDTSDDGKTVYEISAIEQEEG